MKNIVLYKIQVWDKNEGIFRKMFRKVFNSGTYWIEYRIDEDRFWFGKREKFRKTMHHTKNNKVNSLRIVKGIKRRAIHYGYEVKILIDDTDLVDSTSRDPGGVFLGNKGRPSFESDKEL
jgi:hypothetical protein